MLRPRRRPLVISLTVGTVALTLAGPAFAHVTVNPSTAEQGGYSKLTFRVPTESDNASTTKVQVFFPTDQPLASVSVKPHPGWTATVKKSKLADPIESDDGDVTEAVSQITWRAGSATTAIKPGEFDEFDVSVGPLPKAKSMQFKALQTYSDGDVVRWIQPQVEGQEEPEHPAPLLQLLPAGSSTSAASSGGDQGAGSGTKGVSVSAQAEPDNGRATTALVLSIIAVVLAAGAATVALLRRRRG